MPEKNEKEFWDENIKKENKFLWLTTLKWQLYLSGQWIKRRKILSVDDVNWSMDDIYKLIYILVIIMILSTFVALIKDVVYLVYPNYGNSTMIIRDFLNGMGGS